MLQRPHPALPNISNARLALTSHKNSGRVGRRARQTGGGRFTLNGFLGSSYAHLPPVDPHGKVINAVADWFEDSSDVLLIAGDTDVAEMYRMKLEMDGYRVSAIADVGDSTVDA